MAAQDRISKVMRTPKPLLLLVLLLMSATAVADSFGPLIRLSESPENVPLSVAYTAEGPLVLWSEGEVIKAKAPHVVGPARIVAESAQSGALASIGGDRALAVWLTSTGAVMAMRLAPDGTPVGAAVRIGTDAEMPVTVAASEDRYLVAWPSTLGAIHATVLDASANPLVPAMPVSQQTLAAPGELAAASNGREFALVWHTWPAEPEVYALTLDQNAVPASMTPIALAERAAFPHVASNGKDFFAAWADNDEQGIRGARITLAGQRGTIRQLTLGNYARPRIAWDGSAYAMAVTSIASRFNVSALAVWRFNASGGTVGGLDMETVYFPRDYVLAARAGRIDLVRPAGLQTAAVRELPKRSRAVRH